jgi:hypothetical protein
MPTETGQAAVTGGEATGNFAVLQMTAGIREERHA